MPLDESAIGALRPRSKPFKLLDGHWLYLVVTPSGRQYWRLEFHLKGRERTLQLGDFPSVSIQAAREIRNEALLAIHEGRNPVHDLKGRR